MQTENETEQETKRNGDIQKWRDPETKGWGIYWGERKEGKKGRRDRGPFYDIHIHIRPRATLKVHCW